MFGLKGRASDIATFEVRKDLQSFQQQGHFFIVKRIEPIRPSVKWVALLGLVFLSGINVSYGYRLGMLGIEPEWNSLDIFQKTLSRAEFIEAIETVYLPNGYDDKWITIYPGYALIRMDSHDIEATYRYNFAPWVFEESVEEENRVAGSIKKFPLEGLVIAIDPGHIGGEFSQLERRHFQWL